ncbi:hypothetical protein AMS68_008014 [Peltaster fructicola]|uniref:Armadillo repeat-containing protein 8 n=1 Tax=Peltaster fructicola TaxID=286661 RepID=A0A6H0Y615_9PEZI|nr:hypothetical protein AMS68_008014 [Peltaster fructicola]
MAQDAILNLVASLHRATTTREQGDALHWIKNSLVGHIQRKELAVRAGLIPILLTLIDTDHYPDDAQLRQTEQNQVQATVILSSLAAGGHQFVSPLLATDAHLALLSSIARQTASSITARLQFLRNLVASWKNGTPQGTPQALGIVCLESCTLFDGLLKQAHSAQSDKQVQLVCEIIALEAEHNDVKVVLANSNILDTLAALLVSYSLTSIHSRYQGDISELPPPPHASNLPKIITAIRTVVHGSAYRAYRFAYSQWVKDLCVSFSSGEEDIRLLFSRDPAALLPQISTPAQKTVSFSTTINTYGSSHSHEQHLGDAEHVNAIIGWLLVFARKLRGSSRLAALHLLAVIAGSVEEAADATLTTLNVQKTRERERQLAFLAVPLAARLVQDSLDLKPDSEQQPEDRIVKEQACEVLHDLIKNSKDLQLAAADGGAIKSVCSTLRKSFQSISAAKRVWTPHKTIPGHNSKEGACMLGEPGLSAEVIHTMRRRAGALHALASLADKEDSHRKLIVDANVISYLIEGLKPLNQSGGQVEGNTTDVMVAACRAAQNMSRSVAILRTTLIDAGIAKPILVLLEHPLLEMKIAATDACTNLVLNFSPMRDTLLALGVAQTLCRHTKSGPPALRRSSLWAFKHLILQATAEFKYQALEQLGASWILQVARGDQDESYNGLQGGGVALSSANAAGEQIDLLNPAGMDVDDPETTEEDGDEDGELLYDESSKTHYQASSMRSTLHTPAFNIKKQLATIMNAEQNAALQARRDDIAMQEQALDFLRNFICPPDGATMIDHIFTKLKPQDLFDVLLVKISTVPGSRTSRTIYRSIELILAASHLVLHLANGNTKHKEMLMSQQPLLEALLPHFSHPNPHVRVTAVWIVNSLTWTDNRDDQTAARKRAMILRTVGIESAVRNLSNDLDLDVRERAKVAIRQFDEL